MTVCGWLSSTPPGESLFVAIVQGWRPSYSARFLCGALHTPTGFSKCSLKARGCVKRRVPSVWRLLGVGCSDGGFSLQVWPLSKLGSGLEEGSHGPQGKHSLLYRWMKTPSPRVHARFQSPSLQNLQGIVKVGAVDADQHKSLGGQYGVRGFPTIKIFGANKNKPEEYQGMPLKKRETPLNQMFG